MLHNSLEPDRTDDAICPLYSLVMHFTMVSFCRQTGHRSDINYSVQISRRYFGSPMSSDSNALNSYTFLSNIYNCNIIVVYCLNAYRLFNSFKDVLRQTACR